MSVHTGPMRLMSFFTFSRRASPRSTASATAIAWGRVKLTVALMLVPRYVASCFLPSLISKTSSSFLSHSPPVEIHGDASG